MAKGQPSTGDQEQFSYKGKRVVLSVSAERGTVAIDGQTFAATRSSVGMWSSPGVLNQYQTLSDLAKHIVDYLYLFTPNH